MRISTPVALATARLVAALRPDWHVPGILAALRRYGDAPVDRLIYSAVAAALDLEAETPFAMNNPLYRLPFTAADQEFQRDAALARSREIQDRRVLDEARRAHAERDLAAHRRGLAEARAALVARRPAPEPSDVVDA